MNLSYCSLSHLGLTLAEKKWNWCALADLHFKKKKKKKHRWRMSHQNLPPNSWKYGKYHHHYHIVLDSHCVFTPNCIVLDSRCVFIVNCIVVGSHCVF